MRMQIRAKRLINLAAALALSTLATAPGAAVEAPAAAVAASRAAVPAASRDMIQDEPSYLDITLEYTGKTLGWAWTLLYDNVLDWVTPPSPTSLTGSVTREDAMELFKLLSLAGYKLKEIDTQVGIIPTVAFKFGLVRELSEADYDYLETRVEDWAIRSPGVGTSLQKAVMETVIAINTSVDYHVSSLKVQFLPLPKVAFSVSPKITALGEEGSALMRAIQRVERNVQGVRKDIKK